MFVLINVRALLTIYKSTNGSDIVILWYIYLLYHNVYRALSTVFIDRRWMWLDPLRFCYVQSPSFHTLLKVMFFYLLEITNTLNYFWGMRNGFKVHLWWWKQVLLYSKWIYSYFPKGVPLIKQVLTQSLSAIIT